MNNAEKKRKTMQKARAAKKTAMFEAGEASRYHKRKEARAAGKPMADRSGERAPWWTLYPNSIMESFHGRTPVPVSLAA